ncbi:MULTISPECIES: hypothetical protein [Acinetobacter]|uniref:Uncharacterized protein n=1 Tax=Acinetobacter indicus TaxID=756892 RepID=A0A6C0Y6N5_9GAMM|nr:MULTISPECIES: hypothetical protein [Acinetobacter]QIC71914.1 hypothetical protein FSC09_16110 [Acinetobacter indicus]QKQ71451.1 hypothetical protein E5Y90_14565 [Acinetobacter sp. 10FS3-1]
MQDEEKEIALMAGRVLQQAGIAAARKGTVMYVANDTIMSKEPNKPPVEIKKLTGRNPQLAHKIKAGVTYKLKKRKFESE